MHCLGTPKQLHERGIKDLLDLLHAPVVAQGNRVRHQGRTAVVQDPRRAGPQVIQTTKTAASSLVIQQGFQKGLSIEIGPETRL